MTMATVQEGDTAPGFTLPSTQGDITLSALRGQDVVLYFYGKDNTSGWTTEAQGFREKYQEFAGHNTVVLGVSPDSIASHEQFAAKYDLPFPLLSDSEHRVGEAYGVWKERTMYGRTSMGTERSTFLIGPDGIIKRAWRGVRPEGHAEQVLEAVTQQA
jgi:thioredoxin-dependent peroxiredoxin